MLIIVSGGEMTGTWRLMALERARRNSINTWKQKKIAVSSKRSNLKTLINQCKWSNLQICERTWCKNGSSAPWGDVLRCGCKEQLVSAMLVAPITSRTLGYTQKWLLMSHLGLGVEQAVRAFRACVLLHALNALEEHINQGTADKNYVPTSLIWTLNHIMSN